jgi:hypothetical protein
MLSLFSAKAAGEYNGGRAAMIELTDDQLQALDAETQPVAAVDPRTGQIYRLIKQEVYNLVCGVVAPFNRGVEDDPAMDVYEQWTTPSTSYPDKPIFSE